MTRYLMGRLGRIVIQLAVIVSSVFVVFRLVPGDPAKLTLGASAAPEQVAELRGQMGLDQSLLTQYVDYVGGVFTGDFGTSTSYAQGVAGVVGGHIWATLQLLLLSIAIAVTIGIAAGVLSALRPQSLFARGSFGVWILLLAVPNFWLGMILIQIFAVNLGWFPAIGSGGVRALILPAVAIAARLIALIARLTRATMLEVLGEDFIRTAEARGVSPARMVFVHALRPALPPVLTLIGMQAGYLLGGAVVVENLFSYPGMGQLLISALSQRDYELMQGITIFFVAGFLLINLLVDLVSGRIDPRMRMAGARS